MPEITRRRTGEFMRHLFAILMDHPDGMQAGDAVAAVRNRVHLTEYEAGEYPSGGQRFEKILRFATVDTVKAGWLEKRKGLWIVTDAGRKAYQDLPDPEAFYKKAVQLYHQWKAAQPAGEPEGKDEAADPTSARAATVTFEQAEEQAWREIQEYLRGMPPYDFQDLVADLLRAMGYHVAWVSPPGKDGGIDILAWGDPLGTRPPRIKVQVKRVQQKVNVDGLRSFMALLGDDDVGIFVTTGEFTKDAEDEARTQEKRKVTLIDLERLVDLWIQHYGRLSDTARSRLPLQPIWFLAPMA
ncbi:Mrr restriction system protein [Myxococcota bacterium]|nr:Mrr restriction system protein [Myxococcota bacterium]